MTKTVIQEILEMQRKGIEPFMTEQGWELFWKLAMENEEVEVDDEMENVG
jgi:hypothetical protein